MEIFEGQEINEVNFFGLTHADFARLFIDALPGFSFNGGLYQCVTIDGFVASYTIMGERDAHVLMIDLQDESVNVSLISNGQSVEVDQALNAYVASNIKR